MLAAYVGVHTAPEVGVAYCQRCGRERKTHEPHNYGPYCIDCKFSDPEYHRIVAEKERKK